MRFTFGNRVWLLLVDDVIYKYTPLQKQRHRRTGRGDRVPLPPKNLESRATNPQQFGKKNHINLAGIIQKLKIIPSCLLNSV